MTEEPNDSTQEKPPILRSAFLNECFDYLSNEADYAEVLVFPHFNSEMILLSLFPVLTNGLPCYVFDADYWEPGSPGNEPENLMMEISDQGNLLLRPGDDDAIYWDFSLHHAEEIGDCLSLLEMGCEYEEGQVRYRNFPLKSVLDEVLLVLPVGGSLKGVPLNPNAIKAKCPGLLERIDECFDPDPNLYVDKPGYGWELWIEKLQEDGKLDLNTLEGLQDLLPSDYIYSIERGELFTERKQRHVRSFGIEFSPMLALRLNPNVSRMYFWNIIHFFSEGEGLLRNLCQNWRDLPGSLSRQSIKMPNSRLSQIQKAFEFRTAQWNYRSAAMALESVREPEENAVALYRKRIEYADFAKSDYSKEIELQANPLPFMIEWPFRRFRKEGDAMEQIKIAQQLLNILAKLAIFLPLEELLASNTRNSSRWLAFDEELRAKPNSDGALVDIQSRLFKAIAEENASLPVFLPLTRALQGLKEKHFAPLVQARNEYHHPPYDETAFLSAAKTHFDPIVAAFRSGLSNVKFMIPKGMNFLNGKRLIRATFVMGYEAEFEEREIEIQGAFEDFPTGELIAFNSSTHSCIPLKHYFKKEPIQSKSIDFGLFDKIRGGQAMYAFIRNPDRRDNP